MDEFTNTYTDAECEAEFGRLFPHGFFGPDVRDEVALEKIVASFADDPDEFKRELSEFVGRCVWDVFADQHEVMAADGRMIDIGGGRSAGEFIAGFLNRRTGRRSYDYMSFYMGTSAPWAPEGDRTPVYEMIFRRLKRWNRDWVYHYPRVYLIDFKPAREAMDREGRPDWADYSPSEALAKEEEDRQREKEIAEFREELDQGRREDIMEALKRPPPAIVQAYRNVYGDWPQGWPPDADA